MAQNDYTYDPDGNRLTNTLTFDRRKSDNTYQNYSWAESYGYDNLNRLSAATYRTGVTQSYTYDGLGNRTSLVDSSNGTSNYSYDNANRLSSYTQGGDTKSYTYDTDGNMLHQASSSTVIQKTLTWDSQNRMTGANCVTAYSPYGNTSSQVSMTYGPDGLRRGMTAAVTTWAPGQSTVTTDTIQYLLDGQNVVRESDSKVVKIGSSQTTTDNSRTYLIGPRGAEYQRDASGNLRWFMYDGMGNVLGEVVQSNWDHPDVLVNPNSSNQETSPRTYDVYGACTLGANYAKDSHRFVGSLGHSTDDALGGLIYMRARYYDPAIGRFISEDPSGNGQNWYAYCNDNPVNYVDENGQCWQYIFIGIIIVSGILYFISDGKGGNWSIVNEIVSPLWNGITEVLDLEPLPGYGLADSKVAAGFVAIYAHNEEIDALSQSDAAFNDTRWQQAQNWSNLGTVAADYVNK